MLLLDRTRATSLGGDVAAAVLDDGAEDGGVMVHRGLLVCALRDVVTVGAQRKGGIVRTNHLGGGRYVDERGRRAAAALSGRRRRPGGPARRPGRRPGPASGRRASRRCWRHGGRPWAR